MATARRSGVLALCMALAAACADATTSGSGPTILAVGPAQGASGVNPTVSVSVSFSHAMMAGTEAYVALHEASVSGPVVAGASTWSEDRKTLTFLPAAPLKPATTYVLHIAPTMMTAGGQRLDHRGCAALGGQSVTAGMMDGSGMMGGTMGGTMGSGMMGPGWEMTGAWHGMAFTFLTA